MLWERQQISLDPKQFLPCESIRWRRLSSELILDHVNYPPLALYDWWKQGDCKNSGDRYCLHFDRVNSRARFIPLDHARSCRLWMLVPFQSALGMSKASSINASATRLQQRQDRSPWRIASSSIHNYQDWTCASSNSKPAYVVWPPQMNQLC